MATQDAETSNPTAVVPRPRWVLLDRIGHRNDHVYADDVASSRTSTGKDIHVSFRFAEPPATSRLYLRWPRGPSKEDSSFAYPRVIAADADSVLLQLTDPPSRVDYFVYKAAGDQPPLLSLLPESTHIRWPNADGSSRPLPLPGWVRCTGPSTDQRRRMVDRKAIGILRRRDDHAFAVAELSTTGGDGTPVAFELCLLLSPSPGSSEAWELRRVKIRDAKGCGSTLLCWDTDAVVPVGGRSLCWVDYYHGVLLGHVFEFDDGGSTLTYVPLPVDTPWAKPDHGEKVRFVSVDHGPLCVFSLTVWTLNNAPDGSMEWEKDGEFSAADLWAFSGYEHLPHVPPEYPVVSMDDPDGLFFLVSEGRHAGIRAAADHTVWLVEVDTRRRAVRSVARYSKEEPPRMPPRAFRDDDDDDLASVSMFHGLAFLPSEVSKYQKLQE